MKRILFILLVVPLTFLSCNGQKGTINSQTADNQPQKNIKVNKEYDENGNLVKYDSTYSYYYSNIGEDSAIRDSIFENFTKHFNQNYSFSDHPYFRDFFFEDSLLNYDFYKKDFFYDRFKDNMARMDSLFREMDVMKNDFFRHQTLPVIK